jgi:hypothetical protein
MTSFKLFMMNLAKKHDIHKPDWKSNTLILLDGAKYQV